MIIILPKIMIFNISPHLLKTKHINLTHVILITIGTPGSYIKISFFELAPPTSYFRRGQTEIGRKG